MATSKVNKDKVKKAAKKAATAAATNWQPILIGIGVLVGGYLIYKVTNKAGEVADKAGDVIKDIVVGDPNAGGGNPRPGGNKPPKPGTNITITENQAQTIAAALHQAMVVWNGTDEERIFDNLKGKTPNDFAMISQAFGKKRYDDIGDAFWPFPAQTLTYWLNSELKQSEINELKRVMPGVF